MGLQAALLLPWPALPPFTLSFHTHHAWGRGAAHLSNAVFTLLARAGNAGGQGGVCSGRHPEWGGQGGLPHLCIC